MSDLVERLRNYPEGPADMMGLFHEAANEIARLRAQEKALKDLTAFVSGVAFAPEALAQRAHRLVKAARAAVKDPVT